MIKRLASIAGAPMPSAWTRLWLRTVFEEPIISDPLWNGGFFSTDQYAMQAALRHSAHEMAMTLVPHQFYREGLWRSVGFASLDDFIRGVFEGFTRSTPGNLVSVVRKTLRADPSAGGDVAAALNRITAKTFVFAFTGDPMFPAEECKVDADRIQHAKFREISSLGGHLATFALFEQDKQAVDGAIREALES